jgi:hypothetical protein
MVSRDELSGWRFFSIGFGCAINSNGEPKDTTVLIYGLIVFIVQGTFLLLHQVGFDKLLQITI